MLTSSYLSLNLAKASFWAVLACLAEAEVRNSLSGRRVFGITLCLQSQLYLQGQDEFSDVSSFSTGLSQCPQRVLDSEFFGVLRVCLWAWRFWDRFQWLVFANRQFLVSGWLLWRQRQRRGSCAVGFLSALLEQLSVQAVGSRCRDASLRGSCAMGRCLGFCAMASSDIHSVFLLPLQFLLWISSRHKPAFWKRVILFVPFSCWCLGQCQQLIFICLFFVSGEAGAPVRPELQAGVVVGGWPEPDQGHQRSAAQICEGAGAGQRRPGACQEVRAAKISSSPHVCTTNFLCYSARAFYCSLKGK